MRWMLWPAVVLTFVGSVTEGERRISVIPKPVNIEGMSGEFVLDGQTRILCDRPMMAVGRYLQDELAYSTGMTVVLEQVTPETEVQGSIVMRQGESGETASEGYHLQAGPTGVRIRASQPPGAFRACQTIRQLLSCDASKKWTIPSVRIDDQPRFQWRGMHLDSARHFLPKEFVLKYIDLLAYHKFNVFHWHLTEDQGWRIEIDAYPKLKEVAQYRNRVGFEQNQQRGLNTDNGKPYGGIYTKEDIREVVAYAQERFIMVVPEVEMPGHSIAALAAYPELGCTGGPYEVGRKAGIYKDIYCAGNEQVFSFLQGVLDEVIELFPGPYFHIGGDEAPKDCWENCPKCQARIRQEGLKDEHELQSYFIRRMEAYLNQKGKRLIGWDEILEGGLAPNATVMSWRGTEGGIAAARQGHDVVMTPNRYTYFNYQQQDDPNGPGHTWVLPLERVYSFEPVPEELTATEAKHILGAQGCIWTEFIPSGEYVEYMGFPRICALAEVVWSAKKDRDWEDFQKRMEAHYGHLEKMHVNFFPLPSH